MKRAVTNVEHTTKPPTSTYSFAIQLRKFIVIYLNMGSLFDFSSHIHKFLNMISIESIIITPEIATLSSNLNATEN